MGDGYASLAAVLCVRRKVVILKLTGVTFYTLEEQQKGYGRLRLSFQLSSIASSGVSMEGPTEVLLRILHAVTKDFKEAER